MTYALEPQDFYHSFMNGAKEVMKHRNYLNRINVFPVADGDTGSNLYSLMQSIVHHSELKGSFNQTLTSIADSALVGARGNSGMIFAQYIQGFSESMMQDGTIDSAALINATKSGVDYAYQAVGEPVEGTILTVMHVFHESLSRYVEEGKHIEVALERSLKQVLISVKETTDQLKVLKQAHVVDSGAKGFAVFLKGFINGLNGKRVEEEIDEVVGPIEHMHDEIITQRYCTEMLVSHGETIDFKTLLSDLGDSMVVINGRNKSRIHIHTDYPAQVVQRLEHKVTFIEQKVDDMISQNNRIHHPKFKNVIVTDSVADLPESVVMDAQIQVVPLNIMIGDSVYLDKLTIDNPTLLELAKGKQHPVSSQPTIRYITNIISFLANHYDRILILPVARALSGTYHVFEQVIASLGLEKRAALLDTRQNSIAQGLLVHQAAQLLEAGLAFDTIISEMQHMIDRSKILVKIKTLDNMIASGRLSVRAGHILSRLHVRPLITLKEGKGHIEKIAIGEASRRVLLKRIISLDKQSNILHFAVTYIDDRLAAEAFAKQLEKRLNKPYAYIVQSSSVIAAGAGKGAFAVGLILEKEL